MSEASVSLTIDGQKVTVPKGTLVIEACRKAGIEVPHFCYHPGLSPDGNCRMCICDVQTWNPREEKHVPPRRPVVTCTTEVAENMLVNTNTPKVVETRAQVMEFLLVNHPVDCPICDKAGECALQDHYMKHGGGRSELRDEKVHKPRLVRFSDRIVYNAERCILCTRCTRFTEEVTHSHELGIVNRGDRTFVDLPEGGELTNNYQDCVADICPVGALTKTGFRFKARVWGLDHAQTVCGGCSRNCATVTDHLRGRNMHRIVPRHCPEVNGHWMCDEGRDLVAGVAGQRLIAPGVRGEDKVTWQRALEVAAGALRGPAEGIAVFASSWGTNEEAAVAAKLLRDLGVPAKHMAIKADRNSGLPADDVLHTSDHNPNRRGLSEAGFGADPAALLAAIRAGTVHTVIVWGGGLQHLLPESELSKLLAPPLRVIYLGVAVDACATAAEVVFPVLASYENHGSWTNVDGFRQAFERVLKAPAQQRSALEVFVDLAQLLGKAPLGRSVAEVSALLGTPQVSKAPRSAGALFRHDGLTRGA